YIATVCYYLVTRCQASVITQINYIVTSSSIICTSLVEYFTPFSPYYIDIATRTGYLWTRRPHLGCIAQIDYTAKAWRRLQRYIFRYNYIHSVRRTFHFAIIDY